MAQRGGIPGTLQLVKSFLKVQSAIMIPQVMYHFTMRPPCGQFHLRIERTMLLFTDVPRLDFYVSKVLQQRFIQ